MRINHNIAALNTYRQLNTASTNQSKSMEKLSSGLRINKAGDDAAGLAISEKMRGQIRGLDQASRNSQDAISLIQTGEGALNETHDILQRMRELAVQSASDTNTTDDRVKIQGEVDQLAKEITRISNTTEFNTQNLMAGGLNNTFQIGANAGQNIDLSIGAMDAKSLGVAGDLVTTTFTNTQTGVTSVTANTDNVNGLYLNVGKVAASSGAVSKSDALTAATADVTTYTGSKDQTFQVRIDALTAGEATAASYSTDGGTTWINATIDNTGANGIVTLADGAKLDITTDAVNNTVGDTFTFTANAEYLSMQLGSTATGGTTTGTAVKVYNNQSSATVGDANTSVTVNFNFATTKAAVGAVTYAATGGTFADGDQITQTTTSSTAATIGANGTVTKDAETLKGIKVSTQATANNAITTINKAIETVSAERSKLGAYQNRLEHTINNVNTSSENLTAAESRVRDVDMAKEMMAQTKNSILSQAAQAMLAQSNQMPQGVLQLLR